MSTDWKAVVVVAAIAVVFTVGGWWISRCADRDMARLRLRFSDPQAGPVEGTGVERTHDSAADASAALPRSPQTRSPQPRWWLTPDQPPPGHIPPEGAVGSPSSASSGLHLQRVSVHG